MQVRGVAENGIADLEGFQRREAVTADIGAHMHFADLFLNKFNRSEHRAFRTAGAKSRWPCRDRRAENFERRPLVVLNRFQQLSGRVGADLFRVLPW